MGLARETGDGAPMVVKKLGNLYSPSLLFGLIHALETTSSGDLISAVSYGSGSSDAILLEMVDEIPEPLKNSSMLTTTLDRQRAITVAQFQELGRA